MRLTAADLVFLQLFAANISRSGDPAVANERAHSIYPRTPMNPLPELPKKPEDEDASLDLTPGSVYDDSIGAELSSVYDPPPPEEGSDAPHRR